AVLPARRGEADSACDGDGPEILLEHDVDDALVRPVAIIERGLLGQDVDPLDRLGRQLANLAETGDALAVQQDDRLTAPAAAAGAGLRGKRVDQLADRSGAVGADRVLVEPLLGPDIALHLAAQTLTGA